MTQIDWNSSLVFQTLNVELNTDIFSCTVLSCDTITQVKDKCLRIIYKNMAASDIPRGNEIDLGMYIFPDDITFKLRMER